MLAYISGSLDQELLLRNEYLVIGTCGVEQARRYESLLENHFRAIGHQKTRALVFLKHRPELLVSRVEHHYVFHLVREMQCPLILAVLHENMELMNRLRDRLDS